MTGHYEISLRSTALSSSEQSYERVGENNKKDGQSKIIFSVTERKTSIHLLLLYMMSEEESQSVRKWMWKITSGVFIVGPYNK